MKHINISKQAALAVAVSGALILPAAAPAFEAKLSGQVSRMVVIPDDAAGDEIQHVDIGWSGSRFRFTGSDTAENGLTYGFRFEIQARENCAGASNGGTFGDTGDDQDNRYQDLYLSGGWGQVSFGKGDGASNDATEVDLSGTALASSSNHQDNWGEYAITSGGMKWDSIFNMQDGQSRTNRLRYDTPNFSGVSFAASVGQGDATEIAVRYRGEITAVKIEASAGFVNRHNFAGNEAETTGASISALFGGGFNITWAYAMTEPQKGAVKLDQEAWTIKLGYKKGIHAVTVDYGDGETDVAGGGENEADTWGLTYAAFPAKGVEVFVTYRELDADLQSGASTDEVDIFAIGSRIKF